MRKRKQKQSGHTRAVAQNGGRRKGRLLRGLMTLGLFGAVCGALILGAAMAYYSMTMPDPWQAGLDKQPASVRIVDRSGAVIADRGLRRNYVKLSKLPRHFVHAVLATEDQRFFKHFGIDPFGLARAIAKNIRARRMVQGGSTITQQLVKNLFLKPERTLNRKVQELLIALWLEMRLSKKQILELYLNHVYFGAGAHGVEAAAQRYFATSAHTLTLPQSAMLAGLLKAPSRYAPTRNPGLAHRRAKVVLARMRTVGAITAAQAKRAGRKRVHLSKSGALRQSRGAEYVADWVMELLPKLVGEASQDLVIETTLERQLQTAVQRHATKFMDQHGQVGRAGQVAAVILDRSGGVRAMVGGRSYRRSQFNRALKAKRQPGSAFKPFIFLGAVESGLTPNTIAYDEQISIGKWKPRNYSGKFRGAVTLRDGLAKSVNSVAVRLFMDVGRWKVVKIARRLGIRSEMHREPSLALGTSELTLTELASAYVPFSNGGYVAAPHIVKRIRIRGGKTLYARPRLKKRRVVKAPHVRAMNDMMRQVVLSGTGRRARLARHPVGGKTGTTQDSRDAWFVGYSAHLTGGVWVGNDTGRKMNKVTGSSLPAMLWRDLMTLAHRGYRPKALPGLKFSPPRPKIIAAPKLAPSRSQYGSIGNLIEQTVGTSPEPRAPVRKKPESGFLSTDFFRRLLGG